MNWEPIENAPKQPGKELIGACWYDGKMTREPFITFYSPTLGKFYGDPTHFVYMPGPPAK